VLLRYRPIAITRTISVGDFQSPHLHLLLDVIVQYNHEPNANDHARVAQHGGRLRKQLGHFRGGVYTVSAKRLAELAGFSLLDQRQIMLCGYLHDIGNVVNRQDHGQSAALIAMRILNEIGATPEEIAIIISAIGNHEEEIGEPVNPVAAALILADKSDVHKTRVRNPSMIGIDIHDRVNYAAERSFLKVDERKKTISLELTIDTKISQPMEYFEIFMSHIIMCRRAAKFLKRRELSTRSWKACPFPKTIRISFRSHFSRGC